MRTENFLKTRIGLILLAMLETSSCSEQALPTPSLPSTGPAPVQAPVPEPVLPTSLRIISGPSSGTAINATFEFAGQPGASFHCSLDGQSFVPCSSPQSYDLLSPSKHTFTVRETRSSGRISIVKRDWTILPKHHLQFFSYYSYAPDQEGHINLTFLSQGPARSGLSYILAFPFDVFTPENLTTAQIQTWFWTSVDPDTLDPAHPENYRNVMGARFNSVAAIWVTDEPEQVGRPMSAFDATLVKIKSALPGVPLWTNFSSDILKFNANYQPSPLLDWVSIDEYQVGPATHTWQLKQVIGSHQKIFLLPPGLSGPIFDFNSSSIVTSVAEYYQYALSDPRVIGLIVWDWPDVFVESHWNTGVKNLPSLRNLYESIGQKIIHGQL